MAHEKLARGMWHRSSPLSAKRPAVVPELICIDQPNALEERMAREQLATVAADMLAALKAAEAADQHFSTCHQCGADLRGNVWYCDKWCGLKKTATDLRTAAIAKAEQT